ncbi:Gfo/Idh/MocA family protein [Murdochiella vaginalis]|uniref:Gfo/Idh/MocA family protein n=1 Tax=Murdochiella vaginalis TaxID=1852373 RepID=UPI0008FDB9DF|nr:Gfo/Idh/MocA family oxidoreductase [Murdochiella vaginalis]
MRVLKTGIVGCGKVARTHAQIYKEISKSNFTAVCDVDFKRAEAFGKEFNVHAYPTVESMVEGEKLDLVSICTPHPFHAEGCEAAANAGANVIVEKPFSVSIEHARRMVNAGKKNNVLVSTLFQRRLYEASQRVKQAIIDGKIGKPILGNVTMLGWRDQAYYESDPWRGTWKGEGGGVLPTQACHQLDLLLWFMNSEIDTVYGIWRNFNHPYIEVEDTAVAIIEFKNGALGTITASNAQNPALYGKVRVHGDNGASVGVQTDGGAMFIAGVTPITDAPYNDVWTIPNETEKVDLWKAEDKKAFFSDNPEVHYHKLQIENYIDSILEGKPPLVLAEEGFQTVALMEAIYESTKLGKPIHFSEWLKGANHEKNF